MLQMQLVFADICNYLQIDYYAHAQELDIVILSVCITDVNSVKEVGTILN